MNLFTKQKQPQDLKIKFTVTREKRQKGRIDWEFGFDNVHTVIFKIDNQRRPIVQHKEHCSKHGSNLNGKRI